MKLPSPLMLPIPVGGRTVGVGVGLGGTVGVSVGGTVGVGVGLGGAVGPQVRLRVFRPPVAWPVSAAEALSQVKLMVPPGKQGAWTGMVAGTSMV
jgi:hypothetical protein